MYSGYIHSLRPFIRTEVRYSTIEGIWQTIQYAIQSYIKRGQVA